MIFNPPFLKHKVIISKQEIAIGLIWLFQLSAIIGICLGFEEWFLSKTHINLILQTSLLIHLWPFKAKKVRITFLSLILFGLVAEWIGVNIYPIFGDYSYGSNLGFKLAGVPLLIGFNWAVLSFISYTIAKHFTSSKLRGALLGASLMLLLDLVMEFVAPRFDFWKFDGVAPLQNYLSWLLIAFVMNLILQSQKIKGNLKFAFNLYAVQFLFFFFFFIYYLIQPFS